MAKVVYTKGADWAKRKLPGGFDREIGGEDGFVQDYAFTRATRHTQEIAGEDLAHLEGLIADGVIEADEFAITA
jgi:hypothetical protein